MLKIQSLIFKQILFQPKFVIRFFTDQKGKVPIGLRKSSMLQTTAASAVRVLQMHNVHRIA